ncbi:MAG: [LysW]-lysine hydrolase [Anaerolineae bacterium]|nr:[LysW]-lysine hydrolase [Anaerolineae bacterium]
MDSVDLLTGLLQHYSPTGAETTAVSYLVDALRQSGFIARVDRTGNAVGVLGEGPRELVLLGHIDTVPGEIPVRVEDDRLYGRGSVDATGPLACFAAAAGQIGAVPGWRIVVIGALGEEGDSRGARGILHEYRPDFAVIGEPSGWDHVTLGYKGSAWLEYVVTQDMVHTAAQAQSACETAVQFRNRLATWAGEKNAGYQKVFDQVTPSLRTMRSSSDGFTDQAQLGINVRLPQHIDPDMLFHAALPLANGGSLRLTDGIPAYRGEKNSALVRAFLPAIRAAGGTPAFSLKTGTADINLVAPVWGCPAVAYGPGDSALDHTPNEHILLSEYRQAVAVLRQMIANLTQTA